MMMMNRTFGFLAVALPGLLMPPGDAAAQSLVTELYTSDFSDRGGGGRPVGLGLEYHGAPFARVGRADIGLVGAVMGDQDGNFWVGVGLGALMPLDARWTLEASALAGDYRAAGPASDLGSDLEFRSTLGLGYQINPQTSVSFAIHHMSNFGVGSTNPGVNSLGLRLRRSF